MGSVSPLFTHGRVNTREGTHQPKRVKQLEAELAQYKKIMAEQILDIVILKDVIAKKL